MSNATALSGQTAIITGASRGIGKAIALELAQYGMSLCLIGRDAAALEAVAALVEPVRALVFVADLADDEQLGGVLERLRHEVEQIDVLIHNAALYEMGTFQAASAETFDLLYRVNMRVPFVMTQALLPKLIQSKGQVVFINSGMGVAARPSIAQYSATKHALKALADSLRGEVNADGVRVISVYPGRTATDMQVAIHAFVRRDYQPELMLQPEDVAQAVGSALSSARTAEITDLHITPMHR